MLTGSKACIDPRQVYMITKKRASSSGKTRWAEYLAWAQSSFLKICSRTGAIISITWDRGGEWQSDPLSAGSAKRRKYAIQYLCDEVFCSPEDAEWAAPNFHPRLNGTKVRHKRTSR
jgi:hypothetical protein